MIRGAALGVLAMTISGGFGTLASEPQPPEVEASMERLAAQLIAGIERQGRRLTLPAGLQQVAGEVQALFPQQTLELLLIDDPRPNAQSLPSGQILLNLGLLLELETHPELLFVLAHEGAHIELEHFGRRINGSGSSRSVTLEHEADALAREKLRQSGWSLTGIPDLLLRTREGPSGEALPAPPEPLDRRWGYLADTMASLQRQALERLLAVDRIDTAGRFLERHAGQFAAQEVSRWRWMIAQRRSRSPADDRAIEVSPLAGAAEGVPNRFGQCRASAQPTKTKHGGVGRYDRLGELRISSPENWRVALKTGRQIVLTPDSSGLTRLDVWKAGTTPRGEASRQLPCASSRHTLWHAATEFLALEAGHKLSLVDAAETPRGVSLELAFTDESGLRWRLTGWRLVAGGEPVYVLYRAPRQHFFPRHRAAAQAIVSGLEVRP